MTLYHKINEALGDRKRHLSEDQYQTFWVGVMKALPTADTKRDIIPFLVMRGLGEVRNSRRADNTDKYLKICDRCGTVFSFRRRACGCGNELGIDARFVPYEEQTHDPFSLDSLLLEQFLKMLSDKELYVARRWLIDRADLVCQNHLKQIGFELGISAPAVAKYKKIIRRKFFVWYAG